jgi:hypothetical protein
MGIDVHAYGWYVSLSPVGAAVVLLLLLLPPIAIAVAAFDVVYDWLHARHSQPHSSERPDR